MAVPKPKKSSNADYRKSTLLASEVMMMLFSPKKLSFDDIVEMNEEREGMFIGDSMEIDCEHLVQKI